MQDTGSKTERKVTWEKYKDEDHGLFLKLGDDSMTGFTGFGRDNYMFRCITSLFQAQNNPQLPQREYKVFFPSASILCEAFEAAMYFRTKFPNNSKITIHATDLRVEYVKFGREGIYPSEFIVSNFSDNFSQNYGFGTKIEREKKKKEVLNAVFNLSRNSVYIDYVAVEQNLDLFVSVMKEKDFGVADENFEYRSINSTSELLDYIKGPRSLHTFLRNKSSPSVL